ncbi:hypothetical protein CLV59_101290 [Chitinophaga dinghuensis]|uniref:DUF4129 domain-containing protein n=2 Tax=Chitinophaga dinghuensis TaxID=1539050 RepID=A0A327WBI8_9BACT|nr:hypothetical protein CLV59_101290 [Chitinophaga dinghuensis]
MLSVKTERSRLLTLYRHPRTDMKKALCKFLIIFAGILLMGNNRTVHAAVRQTIEDSAKIGTINADGVTDAEDTVTEEAEADSVAVPYPVALNRAVSDKKLAELKENKNLNYIDLKEEQAGKTNWFGLIVQAIIIYITLHIIVFRWVIIGIIAAILLYILYRYMKKNGLGFFRSVPLVGEMQVAQETVLHTAKDYEKKILEASTDGNFKETIRWWYLYTLFQLSENNLIKPSIEKTNKDYLRAMRNTPYYRQFSILTMDYEYVWYGSFDLPKQDFEQLEQQFQDFKHQISKSA